MHAVAQEETGLDALVFVVGLDRGSFEFHTDEQAPETTIQMDLHHAIMQALKIHDERKAAEALQQSETTETEKGESALVTKILDEYVSSSDLVLHACVLKPDGSLLAVSDGPGGPVEDAEQLRGVLHSFAGTYPRRNVDRVFVLDELGTVVLVCLAGDRYLMVVAARDAPLGAVSLSVNKLISRFETAS